MIAHAGGVDEIILALGVVLLFLLFRSARAENDMDAPAEGPCLYCGRQLGPELERCPECGFRARRGRVTSSATAEER
jgi:hypothetical protein